MFHVFIPGQENLTLIYIVHRNKQFYPKYLWIASCHILYKWKKKEIRPKEIIVFITEQINNILENKLGEEGKV